MTDRGRSVEAGLGPPSEGTPDRLANPDGGPPIKGRPGQRRLLAIGLMCGAVACFAVMDASAKWATRMLDPVVVTWFRYAANVAVLALVLNRWTRPRLLHTNRFWLQILRSCLLFLCTVLNFFALRHLQLTQSISIQFAMPLIVALLAGPLLGEWAGPRRLAAIMVGFLGILVITRPGTGTLHPAALLTLASTICYAFYAIATRLLSAYDPPATTMTYGGLAGVALITPVMPFFWTTPPTALAWTVLIGLGCLGAIGHGLLTVAHSFAPAPVLSPFIYTQLVWMTLLGYLVFGDVPDPWTFVGASIVIGSGLYLLYWERTRR